MSNKILFITGWIIWAFMVFMKMIMVFTDYPDFCWDPMFLMVPFAFIIIGGIDTHCCKCCKQHKEEKDKD